MRSVIVPLYWLWCGVSVFILVRRRVTGKSGREPVALSTRASTEPTAAFPALSVEPAPEREPVAAAVATAAATSTAPPPAPPSPVGALADPAPSAAAAVRLGVPISTVDSLAEALEGIVLPCDLAPLIGSGEFDRRSLVLVTSGMPDEVVGTALADEMERLGYALEPLSERSILATNERASVEIAVCGDAETVDDAGTRRFPTAPPNAIVVELRLR